MIAVTGNTYTNGQWGNGEAVIRLKPNLVFSGATKDYFAPTNWLELDQHEKDLGGCGAMLITMRGAVKPQYVLALGKDGKAYLLGLNNFGGIGSALASAQVATAVRGQSAATYRTRQGTYFVFRATSGAIRAYRITATNPPAIVPAWNLSQNGQGSPWVTTTNGIDDAIVWVVNSGGSGDQRLRGFNGDTGAVIYAGGGPNELMNGTNKYNTGIVARGRTYFAGTKVYAFALP